MFGVVTCTLAASNFLYCDFGAETPVAALGVVCPPPPSSSGWEGRAAGNMPCEPGPALLGLFSPLSSVYTVECQHLSQNSPALETWPRSVSLGPCFTPASMARCLPVGRVPSDLLSLIFMVRDPDDSGLSCWSALANLATEECKNK